MIQNRDSERHLEVSLGAQSIEVAMNHQQHLPIHNVVRPFIFKFKLSQFSHMKAKYSFSNFNFVNFLIRKQKIQD